MSDTLSSLPTGTPVWVGTVLLIVGAAFTFSERAAKLAGPAGALARWWTTRAVRDVEQQTAVDARIDQLVKARVDSRMEAMDGLVDSLKTQVAELRADLDRERDERRSERAALLAAHAAELRSVTVDRDMLAAYIEHVTRWWLAARQRLAERGIELSPPPFPTLEAFRALTAPPA